MRVTGNILVKDYNCKIHHRNIRLMQAIIKDLIKQLNGVRPERILSIEPLAATVKTGE